MSHPAEDTSSHTSTLTRFFQNLGPGLVTGAADDDPSGISTYSIAGAQFGYMPLWTAVFSFPLMTAVQLMCGRLGLVTGRGLAGVIRTRYPPWVLWTACVLLITANTINIGADLGGIAEAAALVTNVPAVIWAPVFTASLIALMLWSSYRQIAKILKWFTLMLFAYVVAPFFAGAHWQHILVATFVPHVEMSREFVSVLVAIFGTTISPYLFFWQAAQEVEEERAMGRHSVRQRKGATAEELRVCRQDIATGMLFSNLVMYFIIATTASTLHQGGQTNISTAREAAEALRPLAGSAAYWLFTLGLIGTGMLAVPVLAGSSAYAVAEAARWRGSLSQKPRQAAGFYAVLGLGMLLGLCLNSLGYSAIKMLFWSAVLNGLLAPPLIVLVTLLTSDQEVMGEHVNSRTLRTLGWLTVAIMSAACLLMFVLSA